MIEIKAYLPQATEPVTIREFVEYIVEGNGPETHDYIQYDDPLWGVEAVKE